MGNEPRTKMSRMNRAKQFMPFDALKGFREALREKEKVCAWQEEWEENDEGKGERKGIESKTLGKDRDWREL